MTMKDFILSQALGSTPEPKKTLGKLEGMDETDYLVSSPANAARLDAALASQERISFANEEELRRAIGL